MSFHSDNPIQTTNNAEHKEKDKIDLEQLTKKTEEQVEKPISADKNGQKQGSSSGHSFDSLILAAQEIALDDDELSLGMSSITEDSVQEKDGKTKIENVGERQLIEDTEASKLPDSKEASDKKQVETIDKSLYYEMYDTCNTQKSTEKHKNDYLHRQMANYYRKKTLHVFLKETKGTTDNEKTYNKHLEELEQANDNLCREQQRIQCELDSLKNKLLHRKEEEKKLFQNFQESQSEVAKEFAHTDPVKEAARRAIVERCLKRQKVQFANLKKMGLAYVKCKNKLQETQDALNALDNLGPNLRLIDYEQLRMDNRNLRDRVEENELELTRTRAKCQHAMQVLAHQREKVAAINTDIQDKEEQLENVKEEFEDARQELNYLKQEKGYFRRELGRIKEESGLLTKPKLLRDMEVTVKGVTQLSEKLKYLKERYNSTAQRVTKIRAIVNAITGVGNINDRILTINKLFSTKLQSTTVCESKPT